jgi:hypothetical protein
VGVGEVANAVGQILLWETRRDELQREGLSPGDGCLFLIGNGLAGNLNREGHYVR